MSWHDWRKAFLYSDGRMDLKSFAIGAFSAFIFFGFVAGGIVGAGFIGIEGQAGVEKLIGIAAHKSWAPFGVIAIFIGLSFTGFPQFLLIAAAVVALGPLSGFIYSWIGTMLSAALHFYLGRIFGNPLLRRYGGAKANQLSEWLGRHGLVASAVVRVIPSGPFIVVNLAAGVSHMKAASFLIGTGLGSMPKAGVIAFLGIGLSDLFSQGDPLTLSISLTVFIAWLIGGFIVRRRYRPTSGAGTHPDADG